ncbi:MAG TPA: hypothetical protein EYP19_15915, partial [Desulfobacterales bacterium]|nr:hypothetical protein [Desulfobacterales bacterium]
MERQASLLLWGPPVLSQWLFENWNNPDNLGDESKRAIRMLSPQHHGSDEEMLRRLVIAFEYERILSALQLEDFERFVESVLESKPELSNYQLEMSLPELRTLLTRTFHRSALWPPQGFISLLQEALGAAAKAVERLPEVDPAMNSLSRQRAIESVHDGMDRALICAERFLELVLEFLTRVAGIATLASSDEVNEWLGHAGINPAGKTEQSQWGDKEVALHEAAYRLWKAKAPTGWEYIFPELNNFAFQCIGCPWGKVEHPVTGQWVPVHDKKKEIRNMEPGEIMRVFEELRKCRNPVRHAART